MTEQDKGILLQEIQQIQRTLEKSGRNAQPAVEEEESCSEDEGGYEVYKCKQEDRSDNTCDEDEVENGDENVGKTPQNINDAADCNLLFNETMVTTAVDKCSQKDDDTSRTIGSRGGSMSTKSKKKSTRAKSGNKKKKKNSVHSSSVSSMPKKQVEKIKMANLYVERLFGAFRNKKSKQNLCTVDDSR